MINMGAMSTPITAIAANVANQKSKKISESNYDTGRRCTENYIIYDIECPVHQFVHSEAKGYTKAEIIEMNKVGIKEYNKKNPKHKLKQKIVVYA